MLTKAIGVVVAGLVALALPTKLVIDPVVIQFDYADGSDFGERAIVDKEGNIYVAATCFSSTHGNDIVLLKYNSTLTALQWQARFRTTNNDEATCLAMDLNETLFVCGTTQHPTTGKNFVVKGFTKAGDDLWAGPQFTDGAVVWDSTAAIGGNSQDVSTDIAIDKNGCIFVSGYRDGVADGLILGLEPDGDHKPGWPKVVDASDGIRLYAISVGDDLTVLAGGERSSVLNGWNSLALIYGGSGSLLWEWNLDFADGDDEFVDVGHGTNGRYIAAGEVTDGGTPKLAAYAFSSDDIGGPLWITTYANANSVALAVANSFVYVAGGHTSGNPIVVKLKESTGDFSSTWPSTGSGIGVRILDPPNGTTETKAILISGRNVSVEASQVITPLRHKYLTFGYTDNGSLRFEDLFPDNQDRVDDGHGISSFCVGKVIATGNMYTGTTQDAGTLLYTLGDINATLSSALILVGSGSVVLGNISSSNNVHAVLTRDPNDVNPRISVQVEGTVVSTASELCFELETKVSVAGTQQRVKLYNYDTAAWETHDLRPSTSSDRLLHITIPHDPEPYIDDATAKVKALIEIDDVGVPTGDPWTLSIDLANWKYAN